jgi:hypothetical protein
MKWEYHRLFSEMVCGGYYEEIDRIIDSGSFRRKRRKSLEEAVRRYAIGITRGAPANVEIPPMGSHDDVKMNFCAYMNIGRRVYDSYGDRGLCQLILHIVLDKVNSSFRGAVMASVWRNDTLMDKTDICSRTYHSLLSEISVLTLIRYWEEIEGDPIHSIDYILNSLTSHNPYPPSKKTLRKKRNHLERLISEAVAEKDKCMDIELLRLSKRIYRNIINRISESDTWEQICCAAAKHSRDSSLPEKLGCKE